MCGLEAAMRVPIEDVYAQIRLFAAEFNARKVVLFGSRAKGTNRPKSDIDLAVAGCSDFDGLERHLQDDLWSLLKVDVINLDAPISESLRTQINREGKVLYEKV
ncbi:nucleotidyltransferase family protein [Bifidobacterium felsineum]|nr:nucleotidyltransferase domain-containing protein [Bifidobacterium felsineum]